MDIAKLTFGSDDAELDEKHGFLDKVFLKTSLYRRAKEGQRELLIGRKGAGKSAICLSLKKAFEKEGVSTLLIAPKTMSLRDLEQFKLSTLNNDEAYVFAWRHFLLLKVGLAIYSRTVDDKSLSADRQVKSKLKKIRRFLVRNNELERTLLERVWGQSSSIRRLISKITLKAYGVEGSLETRAPEAQRLVFNELESFQTELNSLRSVFEHADQVILIDKVDEIWADTESSATAIVGMIKAVHELNASLEHTRIILALRSDVYDTLRFSDADKFRTAEERLEWNDQDLKTLIATRGMVSAGLPLREVNALWNSIFEFTVKNESSFQYIINRTMRRPRELIQFCNRAKAIAQDNDHDQIYAEDILNAEPVYSKWKLKDLATEFLIQYPYLEDLLGSFEGFKASFTPEEYLKRLSECRMSLDAKYPSLKTTSNDRILQVLFQIGFLGTVDQDNKSLFSYDDANIILSQKAKILIHPAFHAALGIPATN